MKRWRNGEFSIALEVKVYIKLMLIFYLIHSVFLFQSTAIAEEKPSIKWKMWHECSKEEKASLRKRWTEDKIQEVMESLKASEPLPVDILSNEAIAREYAEIIPRDWEGLMEWGEFLKKFYDLRGIPLPNSDLEGVDLRFALLDGANLSYTNLEGADLESANLVDADLSEANLEGADLESADLSEADLTYAKLGEADLESADLSEAYLIGAELYEANLFGANLSYANLNYADFESADLSGANLEGADLESADLSYANLIKVDLRSADLRVTHGLTIEQLSGVKTLWEAKLNPELMEQVKKKYPHLLEKPKPEEKKKKD